MDAGPRILLFHWNADEARARAVRLRKAGYAVDTWHSQDGVAMRRLRDEVPDLFVIDLSRLPSHGNAVAVALRQWKATRMVPLVFIKGDPEKTARIRERLPDAAYTDWAHVRSALKGVLKNPPRDPIVPGTMESYAATPLPRKLGMRPGMALVLLGAPEGFVESLGPLPAGALVRERSAGRPADLVLLFAKSQADLAKRFPGAVKALADRGSVWICWPKKASGVATDLTEGFVRRHGLAAGLVDYKICAVDSVWSGLLFTRRVIKRTPRS